MLLLLHTILRTKERTIFEKHSKQLREILYKELDYFLIIQYNLSIIE